MGLKAAEITTKKKAGFFDITGTNKGKIQSAVRGRARLSDIEAR